jgi:acyl carrier protein
LKNIKEIRIKEIMSIVFGVDIASITDDASPDNIPDWDSLHHMNLIVALEEAFNIEFTDDQIIEMLNYKLLKSILEEHEIIFEN